MILGFWCLEKVLERLPILYTLAHFQLFLQTSGAQDACLHRLHAFVAPAPLPVHKAFLSVLRMGRRWKECRTRKRRAVSPTLITAKAPISSIKSASGRVSSMAKKLAVFMSRLSWITSGKKLQIFSIPYMYRIIINRNQETCSLQWRNPLEAYVLRHRFVYFVV